MPESRTLTGNGLGARWSRYADCRCRMHETLRPEFITARRRSARATFGADCPTAVVPKDMRREPVPLHEVRRRNWAEVAAVEGDVVPPGAEVGRL